MRVAVPILKEQNHDGKTGWAAPTYRDGAPAAYEKKEGDDAVQGHRPSHTAGRRSLLVPAHVSDVADPRGHEADAAAGAGLDVRKPAAEGQERTAYFCLLYTSPSPRDPKTSRMPSSA